MKYYYYPGCSLEGTAKEYDISTRAFMSAMEIELVELEDWTCCGASAAPATGNLLSLALPARNIALAEKTNAAKEILVPCSACYLNLKQVEKKTGKDTELLSKINTILEEEHLHVTGGLRVRHLLDVLSKDIDAAAVSQRVQRSLNGMTIAPYYGCQCLRPYIEFDDPETPRSMEPLIEATGAKIHAWSKGSKCCGASHMNTQMDVGIELVASILKAAKGADAIVTVCPMCQVNLDAYQKKASRFAKEDLDITVLYLPQLLGLAFGLTEKEIGLNYNLAVSDGFRKKL
ncbi:MAG: CoB--CoM heterodisulfide reductase iron-sulfur subunit B family protein [Deltaproteobacteria bacterium]|nr:CoB--CoM heterodisulfide reductase iron-sulfur subunit B family protein [Deltaproteobacteria bacterium]